MQQCARCQSSQIIKGAVADWGSSTSFRKIFRPDGLKLITATINAGVPMDAYACSECGYVWTEIDPATLRAFVEKHCNKDVP